MRRTLRRISFLVVALLVPASQLPAQERAKPAAQELRPQAASPIRDPNDIQLTAGQWLKLQESVDRGLAFLAKNQEPDGSFRSNDNAQPAITSFCVMAFLSRGHMPKQGPYGEQISRAIDYVLSTQRADGLLYAQQANTETWKLMGNYNHAIAGVMLGEVYGMTGAEQKLAVREGIEKALEFTRSRQDERKRWADDRGGWRYLLPSQAVDSDLSVTAWHLMFYRSAKNAEFDVPQLYMDEAVDYVRRCYDSRTGSFCYALRSYGRSSFSRSMAGAGVVSLALAGQHKTEMAQRAGQFVARNPFDRFNRGNLTNEDRFFYGAFYCSQAMFQIGGKDWEQFYSTLLDTMTENQRRDGSWDLEANQDGYLGYTYTTSLAVLSLTPPFQLLPIYQR